MDYWLLPLLMASSMVTSVIAGVTGMAGGAILLAMLTFLVPQHIIVPIHGITQLASNGFRTVVLFRHIHRQTLVYFFVGAVIGGVCGYWLINQITSEKWFYIVVAVLTFYTALKTKRIPSIKLNRFGFFVLALITTAVGPLIGAVGPILSPFFVRDDFSVEEIVSTKAFCQAIAHFCKIPIFLAVQFSFHDYLPLIVVLISGAYVGTVIGTHVLRRINQDNFMLFTRVFMCMVGVHLLIKTFFV